MSRGQSRHPKCLGDSQIDHNLCYRRKMLLCNGFQRLVLIKLPELQLGCVTYIWASGLADGVDHSTDEVVE